MGLMYFLLVVALVSLIAWVHIRNRRDSELAVVRDQQQRLQVQREQYAAARRVQALAQAAFDQLLEEARSANGGVTPETPLPPETFDLDLRRAM
jgi:hypothetical protein